MSISPTDAHNSQPFPPFPSRFPNPSPRHGSRSRRPFLPPPFNANSPPSAVAAQSAIEANGTSHISNVAAFGNRVANIDESSHSENNGTFSGDQSTGIARETSHARSNQFGSAQGQGRASANANRHSRNLAAESTDFRGNAPQLAPRRNQAVSANHLLNFYYDPISHSQPKDRVPPPRRQQKIKPYNKDLFVQANYKFVIVDRGECHVESIDPDKMLQWEDVICVRYSTPFPVQCPICLESPLCPQITSCGHIYCFPCILQYMLMGEEDNKCECWKKCPLCFMMISTRSLYTVLIDNVKQYQIGDDMAFALLTRQKNSLHPMIKEQQAEEPNVSNDDILFDPFSKFVLTSDVELSVREAKVDLQSWLQKADSGLVDDLEKLPYVCAALEQLDDRMRSWVDHHTYGSSPPGKHSSPPINSKVVHTPSKMGPKVTNLNSDGKNSRLVACQPAGGTPFSGLEHDKMRSTAKFNSSSSDALHGDAPEHLDGLVKSLQSSSTEQSNQNTSNNGNTADRDSYSFYQVTDGQHLILHPLNMKCLLHHYGSYDNLPQRVSGKILELETVTQTEAMRRRYRYLSHFSLTTTFQLCEIDLSSTIPASSLAPFRDEIKKRDKSRRQLARKEENQRARAEAAFMHMNLIPSNLRQLPVNDVEFLAADFEALGSNFIPSSSPPTSSERITFSHVARLGFAAAHDSPSLRAEEVGNLSGDLPQSSTTQGPTTMTTLSFANVITSDRVESPNTEKTNGSAKKGKKPSKVLLTTSGGRRY